MREYAELVGFRVNGRDDQPPPPFPATCPTCAAPRTDDPTTVYDRTSFQARRDGPRTVASLQPGWWAAYACGGAYTPKPQIQNHTERFWGTCGAPTGA